MLHPHQPLPRCLGGARQLGATGPPRHAAVFPSACSPMISASPARRNQAERRGRIRWISPEHEAAGGPAYRTFSAAHRRAAGFDQLCAPARREPSAASPWPAGVSRHHASAASPARIAPATLDDLIAVMLADHLGRPPLVSRRDALSASSTCAPRHSGSPSSTPHPSPSCSGRHLIALGFKPGPQFQTGARRRVRIATRRRLSRRGRAASNG